MSRFVLLHSPLLGPLSWRAVAKELIARGHAAETPAWPKLSTVEARFYGPMADSVAGVVDAGEEAPILVAHGQAGPLIPALAARLRKPPVGVIFADAVSPHPGRSWFDTSPEEVRGRLREGAQMGQLPPWDDWWPPGALERLVPDDQLRAAVVAELEPIPIDFFEEAAPRTTFEGKAAYLKLSGAYEEDARLAGMRGWPVLRLPFNHLAVMTQSSAVATQLERLSEALASV